MASREIVGTLRASRASLRPRPSIQDFPCQCLVPIFARGLSFMDSSCRSDSPKARSLTPERSASARSLVTTSATLSEPSTSSPPIFTPPSPVLTTIYKFPTLEPLRTKTYPANHLALPLRRDLLHRAVVYEGDGTRQGTASTKWRSEVHGSNRKIRPQKGSGKARLGDKKSPMLRGGGVAFGPKPRSFATELPRKMYDLAWRTALSYRWRRGELVVVADGADLIEPGEHYLRHVFKVMGWGREAGRSLVITQERKENLFSAMEAAGEQGRALCSDEVDVKNLLEMGRVIVEESALDTILADHVKDLSLSGPPRA